MTSLDEQMTGSSEPTLNTEIRDYMLETARWARFISIVGFVGIGFMLLVGFIVLATGSFMSSNLPSPFPVSLLGGLYLLGALLYFFPIYYLYKGAKGWKHGLTYNSGADLTDGFRNFKSHYKFMGISLIVVLSLYALFFLFGILMMMAR